MADKPRLTPTTSYFDERDLPSMGDPEFAEGQVRLMLDNARKLLFEADNPQAGVPALVEKWAKELSPANGAYIQTMSVESLNAFLRARGCGTDDEGDLDPVRALVASTISRFVETAMAHHDGQVTDEMAGFAIDAMVEDTVMALRGLDNPAD